jgi:hypothetical protein
MIGVTVMRLILTITAFLVALIPVSMAQSDQPAYNFVAEYIREIGEIEKIRDTAAQELKADPANILASCIRNNERFQLELATQVSMMKSIQLTGQLLSLPSNLASFYQQKIDLFHQMSDGCAAMMAGPQPNVDYGAMAAEIPKINAHLEFIDKALFQATPLIFASLIDQRPDSQNHLSHLIISKAERSKLISLVDSYFGPKLDQKDQNYTVSSASVLKAYLNKDYKCSDDPW